MEYRNGFHSGRNNSGKTGSPRNDRQQPIIIQNFELLTPNQLKFKRKSLSTANLYLSTASLSRQGAWPSQNRPMSEQSPRTGLPEFLDNDVTNNSTHTQYHHFNGFTKPAEVPHGVTPSSLLSTKTERSGVRKHVTFADTLPTPYSLANNMKMWQTSSSVTNDNNKQNRHGFSSTSFNSSFTKPNSNIDLGSSVLSTKYGHLSSFDKTSSVDKPIEDLSGTSKSWSNTEQGHLHDTNDRAKMNDPPVVIDTSQNSSGQLRQAGRRGLHEGVVDDRKKDSEKVMNSNDSRNDQFDKRDVIACVEKDKNKNEVIDNFQCDTVLSQNHTQFVSEHSGKNSKHPGRITLKAKNVSFNLPEDDDKRGNDNTDDKESSKLASCQWYDVERSENQEMLPTQNVSQSKSLAQRQAQSPAQVPKQNTFTVLPQAHGVDFSQDQISEFSKVLVTSNANQLFKTSDTRKTVKPANIVHKSAKVAHPAPDCTVSVGSKVIRLNFLKDELDIYRREEDPLHPKHQRKDQESEQVDQTDAMDFSDLVPTSVGNLDITDTKMNGRNELNVNKRNVRQNMGFNRGQGNTTNKENTNCARDIITTKTNSNFKEIAQLKSQSNFNTDFLMQIYSASGDRKPNNEISVVSQVNQIPSDKSKHQEEGQQVRQTTYDDKEDTSSHHMRPLSLSLRSRDRERRLLSALPMRASRSLDRPRSRSSSASGLCKGREAAGQGKMTTAERFLFRTDKRTAERTDMNKRLEHLVVSSIQYNRSRSLMARTRSNLM